MKRRMIAPFKKVAAAVLSFAMIAPPMATGISPVSVFAAENSYSEPVGAGTQDSNPLDESPDASLAKRFVLNAAEFNKEVMGIDGKAAVPVDIEEGTEYGIFNFSGAKVPGSTEGQIGLKKNKGFIVLKAPAYGILTVTAHSAKAESTSYLAVTNAYGQEIEPKVGSGVLAGKTQVTLTYEIEDMGRYKIGHKDGITGDEIRLTELVFDTEGGTEEEPDKPVVSDVTSFEVKSYLETTHGITEKTEESKDIKDFDYGMYSFYNPIIPSQTNDTLAIKSTSGYVNFYAYGAGKLTIWARSAGADRTSYMAVRSTEDGSSVSEVNGRSDEEGSVTIAGNQEQTFVFNIDNPGGYNIGYAKLGSAQIRFYAISFERDVHAIPGDEDDDETVKYKEEKSALPLMALPKNTMGVSFTVSKNDAGKIVSGKAVLQMKKPVVTGVMAAIMKDITEGAPVDITVESVKKGDVVNTVTVNSQDIIGGTKLTLFEKRADGSLGLANGKAVKVSAKGDLKANVKGTGNFVLLNAADAVKAHEEIVKTVRFVSDNMIVSVGGKKKLAFAEGFSMENVKKMKFSVAEKNVVQVDKSGVLTGVGEGTAVVKMNAVMVDGSVVEHHIAVQCRP